MSKLGQTFRLMVPAGKATPQPPVGSALGQRGLNLMNFCKAFNDQTAHLIQGTPMQVHVTSFPDRTFTFVAKMPPSSHFILKAAGLEKGASAPGNEVVGALSVKHIYEIAKVKSTELGQSKFMKNGPSLEPFCRSLVGQCKAMGIEVYDPRDVEEEGEEEEEEER